MNRIKNIAFSAMLAIGAFSAVIFTACHKDECKGVVCNNGGACVGGTCQCATGYEGSTCLTESRAKFIKSWNASYWVGNYNLVHTVAIGTGASVIDVVISNGFSNHFFANNINATVEGNVITIPNQSPDNSNFRVSGTGTYADGKITWNYTIITLIPSGVKSYTSLWQ